MPSLKYLLLFLIWAEESMIWNGNKVNSLFKILIPVWIFEYSNLLNSVCIGHRCCCSPCLAGVLGGTKFHKDSKVERLRSIVYGWSALQFDRMVGWGVCGGDSYLIEPRISKMINTGEKARDVFLVHLWRVKVTGCGPASLGPAVNVRLSRMQEDGALNVRENTRTQKETRDNPVTQWKEHRERDKVKEKRELAS